MRSKRLWATSGYQREPWIRGQKDIANNQQQKPPNALQGLRFGIRCCPPSPAYHTREPAKWPQQRFLEKVPGALTLSITHQPIANHRPVVPRTFFSGDRHVIFEEDSTCCLVRLGSCKLRLLLFWLIILGGCTDRQLTAPTPQMDAQEQFWIRVLLFENITACTLTSPSSFSVFSEKTQTAKTNFEKPHTPISIDISAGTIVIDGHPVAGQQVIVAPDKPHIFTINGRDYRGKLKLIINIDGSSFDAINLVPLEPYLAGVVGAEMPDYWEPEALQAQAIASRTYCLYIKRHFGGNRNWDLKKTQAHQVYLGLKAESGQIWDAVNKTQGRVLVCTHPDGTEDIFPTYYSSACGGHTESSKHVFGDSFTPLVGVDCPYCKDVAKRGFFFWPIAQFDKTTVTTSLLQRYPKLKMLGEVTNIVPARQSDYGRFSRLTSVKLVGSSGTSDFLAAEDLRLTIDPTGLKLKSTICRIISMGDKWLFLSGRGYGHGVGMCQCGAQAMARQGKRAAQILSYYYPGSKFAKIY